MLRRNVISGIDVLSEEIKFLRAIIPVFHLLGLCELRSKMIVRIRTLHGIVEDLEYELQKFL